MSAALLLADGGWRVAWLPLALVGLLLAVVLLALLPADELARWRRRGPREAVVAGEAAPGRRGSGAGLLLWALLVGLLLALALALALLGRGVGRDDARRARPAVGPPLTRADRAAPRGATARALQRRPLQERR